MYCRPPRVLPAVVHPTKCCVQNINSTTVVPHIHPTHTTTVNHEMFQHKHYFPQTQSVAGAQSHQHFNCGPGAGPGLGAGQGPRPGFGPGQGPGFMGPR